MRIRLHIISTLVISTALSILLGCGTVPTSQPSEGADAPTTPELEQPTAVTTQLQPESKAIETVAVAPKTTLTNDSEFEPQPVEVGYKVGMQAPEFGMSLIDGSTLTTASLANQGKPIFLYFHATW